MKIEGFVSKCMFFSMNVTQNYGVFLVEYSMQCVNSAALK